MHHNWSRAFCTDDFEAMLIEQEGDYAISQLFLRLIFELLTTWRAGGLLIYARESSQIQFTSHVLAPSGERPPHKLAIRGPQRTISGPQDTNGESLSN